MKAYRVQMRDTETGQNKFVDMFAVDASSARASILACANPFIEVIGVIERTDDNEEVDEYTIDDLGRNWW